MRAGDLMVPVKFNSLNEKIWFASLVDQIKYGILIMISSLKG